MIQNVCEPVVFVRHGETAWNLEARFQGSTNTQLAATGQEQARNNGQMINRLCLDGRLDKDDISIISSPLARAHETASIICDELGMKVPLRSDDRIREISMGRWEGLTSQEVKDKYYEERKTRKLDPWQFAPEGGESCAHRLPEVQGFLKNLTPNTIVITHAGILRIVFHFLANLETKQASQLKVPHNGIFLWQKGNFDTLLHEPSAK